MQKSKVYRTINSSVKNLFLKMQLKYIQSILSNEDLSAKVVGLSWAPNNLKLAVATADRTISLFDDKGEKKDKFSLKPADSKYGKKSFDVTSIAFSPDSTKIAVGQTDNIVYVYKIGEVWGDKKVICNKFPVNAAVTCLIWLAEGPLIFGTADGKVRSGNCKTNKTVVLYTTDSFVVSLSSNFRGSGFLSGHSDGSVVRYYVNDDSSIDSQGIVVTCSSPPYALVWTLNHIMTAGSDKKVAVYEKDGKLLRSIDFIKDDEKEFSVACSSPSGQAVALGSFNRVRLFSWNSTKNMWEENMSKTIKNMYTITALDWKKDGTRLACGTLCGGVLLFESVLKRKIYKNKFEITYVGPSQIIVKNLNNSKGIILKSQLGHEIDDVRIMGKDRYVVARTLHTIFLGDLEKNLISEIMWPSSGRNEKFYFDNANVCLIFNVGELTLIEYGKNEILGSVRTEFMNPHVISVRLNERKVSSFSEDNKKLAYLLDLKTICVMDLVFGVTIALVSHDAKVDWLELNETSHKLLFRDKKQRLMLLDPYTGKKEGILTNCTFVQWVPNSDVVIAQSLNNLCIWYNIDTPERVTLMQIKGEVIDVIRADGKTEVIVQDGVHQVEYELDEGLVEFGTAVHDKDFARAIFFLEKMGNRPETDGMWQNLAGIAFSLHNLKVAERCFAALGDASKTHFLKETILIGEEFAKCNNSDILSCPEVWARLAILGKQLKTAEQIYMEQNEIDKAIKMYQAFFKWEEVLNLAASKGHSDIEQLREKYMKWLIESHQEEKAGILKEKEGNYESAVNFYINAKQPGKAFRLLQNYSYLLDNDVITNKVVTALIKSDMMEQAGLLYEKLNNFQKALECYKKGNAFGKAVDLAKRVSPNEIKILEEQWGNWLVESKQLDAAINHFIEAGKTVKALEAAVSGRQWKKAYQIIQVIDNVESVKTYYQKIGEYFLSVNEYSLAETALLKCGMFKEVIDMYNKAGQWDKAYRIASEYLNNEDVVELYLQEAERLEKSGKLKEAEKLFITILKPDKAISMYKKYGQYDNMMRLIKFYHPELVLITHKHLGQELESGKQYKAAEHHYLLSKEWKAAVNMYVHAEMWNEAYRIAKNQGGLEAGQQVAFMWAKTLGGDAAVKLLNKFNILEECINYCCDNYQFDFAFELAKISKTNKIPFIHYKYAMALEDEGKFEEAEKHFLKAGKPKEAISMYIHAKEWEKAENIAESHDKDILVDVLLAQAKSIMDSGNPGEIESLLLRAQKPEMVVKYYQDNDMWTDALRVCEEYIPSKLHALKILYDKQISNSESRNLSSILGQARKWEQNGQFKQALQCYLKISSLTSNKETLTNVLLKAASLVAKLNHTDDATSICKVLCPQLIQLQQWESAGQLYMKCGLYKEAIDVFIDCGEWDKARKIVKDCEPNLEIYVENRYKGHLETIGDLQELIDMNATAALDHLARQGSWVQCFETAKQFGSYVLHKYVAIRATQFIKEENTLEAMNLYIKFEAPAFPENYSIYKRICKDIFGMVSLSSPEDYDIWARLRTMLFSLTENLRHSSDTNSAVYNEFETFLTIAHYYAARSAYKGTKNLFPLATKISIALLRYTDIIPLDKGFFEAGIDARAIGKNNEAFVFLNHYLDICEAIEEGNSKFIHTYDFTNTDFPLEVILPERRSIDSEHHEEIKDWVLSVSMDQSMDQMLPLDDRNLYESSLTSINSVDANALPCVVTGYPVLLEKGKIPVEFKNNKKVANREDWNSLIMTAKTTIGTQLNDVITFISEWCGNIPNVSF